jgi:predicted secreted acid phosphatase
MGFEIQKQIETLFKGYYVREKNHFYEEVKKDHELAQLLGDTYHQLTEFVAKQV